jgi:hypothetical protein
MAQVGEPLRSGGSALVAVKQAPCQHWMKPAMKDSSLMPLRQPAPALLSIPSEALSCMRWLTLAATLV